MCSIQKNKAFGTQVTKHCETSFILSLLETVRSADANHEPPLENERGTPFTVFIIVYGKI